ncbi:hypothetical protein N7510_005706 [Penicillium lagena]|uniref:uncharacterized protein n=1 Tax=Penicillium lagena TaxID=94218 RepID=UPI00253FD002|nr:uncharacterized protein N7510_005706 [Penicillium lagena]KAJ5612512.1 hypothetical protein N7510_005706 [Penicillium lagena]
MATELNGSPPRLVRLPRPTHLNSLKPVYILDIQDERANTLRRLLQQGHTAVAPLREPKLILHSHLPHLLGSAYFLGASAEQLEELYEHEVTTLKEINDTFITGAAISRNNWREFLGQKSYTVAYVQYFDEELKRNNGDWKKVLRQYLFPRPEPLINGFSGGLGHPFIHLAYAWELRAPTVATEALSLGCTENIEVHGLLDNYPADNSTYKTSSLADVIRRIHDDKRFDGLFEHQGITNAESLMQQRFEAVLEHWNAWEVDNPLQQLENCCDVSVLLAIATGDRERKFDFYLVHTMTVAHALRVLWELFPEDQRSCILRQYALFVIIVYICQLKPEVNFDQIDAIESVQLADGDDWDLVARRALRHKWMKDSHFFKVIRAPKAFEETYGSKNDFYRKASAKFLAEFDGWEGFGLGVEGFLPNRDGYIPE